MSPTKPSRPKRAQSSSTQAHRSQRSPSAFERAMQDLHQKPGEFPNISARWLLGAAGIVLLAAAVLAWFALCLLYWQGSWQLLYHPRTAILRTPASLGLTYEPVRFAATETGATQLTGWWLPGADARFTVLYLHGADGNLSDTVDTLAALHNAGLAVFAIDYRGYGQSRPSRPSEKQFRQDAEWALSWLTVTSHIPAKTIVVYGSNLGANLAAEFAADHSELAGVILEQPLQNAMIPVLNDSRSRLVPAHWLVSDRYDLNSASATLRIPSLWLITQPSANLPADPPAAYQAVASKKTGLWLKPPIQADPNFAASLHRWLDDL